jgi:hypothetical protein
MDALGETITKVPDLGNFVQRVCIIIDPGFSLETGALQNAAAGVVGRLPRLRALHFRRWAPDADFLQNAVGDFRELAELFWEQDHQGGSMLSLDERLIPL